MLTMVNNFEIIMKIIMKKEFENIFEKIKHENKDFSSHKRDWKNCEQNNKEIA